MTNTNTTPAGFTATPAFTVNVKLGFDAKHAPVTLLAIRRDEMIVLLSNGTTERTWTSNCREYVRMRKVIKVLTGIIKLGNAVAKSNAAAKRAAVKASEEGPRGTCAICKRAIVVGPRGIVLHGYQRPGSGWQTASCYGAGYPNLEVSAAALVDFLPVLERQIANLTAALANLPTLAEIVVMIGTARRPATKTYARGEIGFDRALASKIARTERELDMTKADFASVSKELAAWRPVSWPA